MKHFSPTIASFSSALAGLAVAILLSAAMPTAQAAPVDSKQAAAVVTGWLGQDPTPLGAHLGTMVQRVDTFTNTTGSPAYYVVYLDPTGFVIVAGDDLVEPIIAFAPVGRFDPSDTNPLGAMVSRDVPARVEGARMLSAGSPGKSALQCQAKWQEFGGLQSGPASNGPIPKRAVSISDVRIAPLTQTTWDQQTAAGMGAAACYNYYTPPGPDGSTGNYPAGCVATALAQLIRYYQFPTVGVGTAALSIQVNGSSSSYNLHGGDLAGGPYVWSNMPLVPSSNPGTAQCQAIGALVADAGATVHMDYGPGGSSASALNAKTALVNNFYYANAIKGWNNNADIGSGLTRMINPNLDARYPVLLGVEGSSGGHAVVADGYGYSASTLFHHLNLGWSGANTAWYALPVIDTTYYTFNVLDQCVYNAYTNGTGEIISGRVLDQTGRPVINASVSATRSGGGTYTTITDTNGIYALARIPSASSYSVTITKANYSPVSGNFSTGTSYDMTTTIGNYWGADFTMNMLTTAIDHLVWSAVSATQSLNTPFGTTITAQNLLNGVATGFAGPVALTASASGAGASTTIIGNLTGNWYTSGDEMTLGYAFTPSTNVQAIAVRGHDTDKVSIWTDSGTLLGSQAVSASGSWAEAPLASPIALSAGTTYRVGAHLPAGMWGYYRPSGWPTSFANGTVGGNFYYSYGDICPTSVYGTAEGPLVDLRYQVVFTNSVPVSPISSGSFASGIWNGNVTLSQVASNVVLKADDGAGHTALSNPFNVVDPNAMPPRITTQPLSQTNNTGDNVTFSLVALSGPAPSYYWRRNSSPISGANASSYTLNNVQLPDSGSQFSCVVSNTYGAVTSQTATLSVTCTNVVVAVLPSVTLNSGAVVWALAPSSDGSLIFGGSFTNVNGLVRSNLARLTPSGVLDTTWNPGPNNTVYALALSGTNLYVGGGFSSIGGVARNSIAKLGTTGSGAVDATWNPSANDWVISLLVNGTDIYAGGYFTYIGQQNRSCIAKLNGSGTGAADAIWNPNAIFTGNDPDVGTLAISGTSIYAGGYFTNIGGLTRYGIARLSTSGTGAADATWNPGPNQEVYAVAASGPDVYVAGAFTYIGGQYRTSIAKLAASGAGLADATWNPNPDSYVYAIGVKGLCLYAGGGFTNIGGLHRAGLAKLSTLGTGTADNAWEADCDKPVEVVGPGSTALYAGGFFTQVAGQARPGLAALTFAPLRLLAPQRPGSGPFQCTLSGERCQGFEILASSNLQNWDLVATLTNSTGTTNYTDPATGLKRRFYRAQQLP